MPEPRPASVWISTTDGLACLMTATICSCSARADPFETTSDVAGVDVAPGSTAGTFAARVAVAEAGAPPSTFALNPLLADEAQAATTTTRTRDATGTAMRWPSRRLSDTMRNLL